MNDLQGLHRTLRNKIPVYPIKMRDALDFYEAMPVLNIQKDSMDDAEIIQMSYLKFLLILSSPKEASHLRDKLFTLLKLIFRTDDIDIGIKYNDEYFSIIENPDYCFIPDVPFFVVVDGQVELTEFDFSKIKNLVSEQNMIEVTDDGYQSKEYREAMERAKKFMEKKNGKQAPLDERILAYQYEMKIADINSIFDMTLYQFNRSLESIAHIKSSDSLQHAVYSGMVSTKDNSNLPTWLSAIERNKENPLLIDADKFASDMNQALK